MLEKFLSIPNSFGVLWLVLTLLSIIVTVIIARCKKIEWDDALMGWMVSYLVILIFCICMGIRVEKVTVSDYQWKQVYTNGINAKVTLEPVGFFVNNDAQIEAGQTNPDFDFTTLTGDQSQNDLLWKDGLNEAEVDQSSWKALQPIFEDGQLLVDDSLATIRERLANERTK